MKVSRLDRSKRIEAFILLGKVFEALSNEDRTHVEPIISEEQWTDWMDKIESAKILNPWFTKLNVQAALGGLSEMLKEEKVLDWVSTYINDLNEDDPKKVGVIMAGNIPLVGFHDMMSVLISGHIFLGRMSSEDRLFYPLIKNLLVSWDDSWKDRIVLVEDRLEGMEAVIATGSNSSAKHFEYYFSKYPNIIRKNRNGIAIFSGSESKEEIFEFGKDVFQFYGLGCRSVSKVYLPEGFELNRIFEGIYEHNEVIKHNKWCNNYDYNKAVFLMSQFPFLDNNFILLKEDEESIVSPLGTLYYAYYSNKESLIESLNERKDEIQCIIGNGFIPFGRSQYPELWDYADDVDSMAFLTSL